jgi:hypothetical protein
MSEMWLRLLTDCQFDRFGCSSGEHRADAVSSLLREAFPGFTDYILWYVGADAG